MIFLFVVPGIPATLGNFLIPLMIGAKDVAFPRLNLLSFYIYVIGAPEKASSVRMIRAAIPPPIKNIIMANR